MGSGRFFIQRAKARATPDPSRARYVLVGRSRATKSPRSRRRRCSGNVSVVGRRNTRSYVGCCAAESFEKSSALRCGRCRYDWWMNNGVPKGGAVWSFGKSSARKCTCLAQSVALVDFAPGAVGRCGKPDHPPVPACAGGYVSTNAWATPRAIFSKAW